MDLELTQIHEYKVFKDTGKAQFHNGKVVIPDGFQKIRVHGKWSYLMVSDTFLSMFRLCSCGTKPQRSENHHFVMTSSWEPQCHHDIIMRTPRITGKPKFSWSGGLQLKYPFFELGIKHRPQIYLA